MTRPERLDGAVATPEAVRWIVARLEERGYETWTVGGAVRDALAGRPSGDWDLATRAEPAEVRRIFKRTVPVGVEHGTVGVLKGGVMYEVTTFRRDVETFGRHAVVAFAETLEEDLERRDFTINALAWHPLRELLLDPHGGLEDLRAGRLRTVGDPVERFAEDYLRVLRALRFAGRFHLEVESETWDALCEATRHLGVLSPERVREELWKVLSTLPAPGRALKLYRDSGALAVIAPELQRIGDDEGDLWTRALAAVDRISRHRPELRLAALLGDVGTPAGVEDDPDLPKGAGPAGSLERRRGMVRAAALLTRLRHSNARTARVAGLVGAGPELPPPGAAAVELRRWLARVERERVADLFRWAVACCPVDAGGSEAVSAGEALRDTIRALRRELHAGVPLTVGELALTGRDLIRMGLRPGPHFAGILGRLLERVLEDPALNDAEVLGELARKMADDV